MRSVLLGFILGFIFIGCTTKTQTDIKPYVTMSQNKKQTVKINFTGVNDRRDTKIAATVLQKGVAINQYSLSNDVPTWYTNAITRELKSIDMFGDEKSQINVMVNIKEIKATYKKYSLSKKNMQVHISLELIVRKANTTTTSNININQSVYKPMILDAEGFTSILNESMRDSVSKTISILIKKI